MPILRRLCSILMLLLAGAPARAIVGASSDGAALAPYVVMVLNHSGRVAGFCSGLVVAPRVVLTAAHCVPAGAAVKVHYRDAANAPVLLDVAEILRHPGYRPDAIRTRERSIDLALVRLAEPLPSPFQPATLGNESGSAVGTPYRLAGFGLTREERSGHLRPPAAGRSGGTSAPVARAALGGRRRRCVPGRLGWPRVRRTRETRCWP